VTAPARPVGSRALMGALASLGGALLVLAGTWLPWLTSDEEDLTGWEMLELRTEYDENRFAVGEMFRDSFDPFFTGGTTLALGVLALALVGIGLLVAMAGPSGALSPPLRFAALGTFAAASAAMSLNVLSILRAPSEVRDLVGIGLGLLVVMLGGLIGVVGMVLAGSPTPAVAAGGVPFGAAPASATTAALPTSGAPAGTGPAPGWYADATGRHQLRYWDGTAWTANVGDGGVQGQDPI
jgi:hypothetical protein